MRPFFSSLATFSVPLLLGGCVVAWGSSYQIQAQTRDGMEIQYDTHFIDDTEIEKLARDHCKTYGRTPLLQSHDVSMMNITTDHFLCKDPLPNTVAVPK